MTRTVSIGIRAMALSAVTAVLITGCGGANTTAPTPPSGQITQSTIADLESFYDQQIQWRNCGGADCTTFEVPLDYNDPQVTG